MISILTMAELPNKKKLRKQEKEEIRFERKQAQESAKHENCVELTNILNQIVQSQSKKNGLINDNNKKFSTQCPEFNAFKRKINNDSDNKIAIDCNTQRVNSIRTHIDTNKDLVTYELVLRNPKDWY